MIDTNSNKGKININFITPTFGGSGKGAVSSVNGRTGDVVLTAEDVKALPEDTYIPSLEGYATEEYVDNSVENLELENYYTKEEVDEAVKNVEVDLTGYATHDYVQYAIEGLEGPMGPQGPQGEPGTSGIHVGSNAPTDEDMLIWIDLDGTPDGNLATMGYVDQAIKDAAPDLTPYALKEEVPSTLGFATVVYVDDKIDSIEFPETDLSDYYTKTEVDAAIENVEVDLTGYATEKYVDEAIEAIPDVDLTGYATEQYVDEAIGGIPEPDLSNYYNKDEIDAALENVDVDLTGYATETYVDDAIEAIEIPETDLTNYYTKTEVDKAISDAAFDPSEIAEIKEVYVGTEEPGPESDALIWINPNGTATPLATESFVQEQINSITVVDEVSY